MEFEGFLQIVILTADPEQDELCKGDERNEHRWRPLNDLFPICHAVEVLDQSGVILLIPAKKMGF